VAAARGLTHLAVTDHDRIDGALEARDAAPPGLTVLVGQEIKTDQGDLIGLFLTAAVPSFLSPQEAIAAVREQGGLVGIPHPFDRFRGSLGRDDRATRIEALADLVDWVEAHNARLVGSGNERAAELALRVGLPGVAVSDAHTTTEVGVAYTAFDGDAGTPAGLLTGLASAELVRGRGSYLIRLVTPVAKVVQSARGNGRGRSGATRP
jgi:predicted metal-dependent phosphoesterase TrpH